MKKILLVLSVFLMVFGIAGVTSAVPYLAVDSTDVWLTGNNPYARWTFDLDNDDLAVGDINPEDTIVAPNTLSIDFWDDDTATIFGWEIITEEQDTYVDGNYRWQLSGEVDPGTWSANISTSLLSDHILIVDMFLDYGDFGVSEVRLAGNYTDVPGAAPVPEPATMLLLGSGLMGLAGFRKKFFKKS